MKKHPPRLGLAAVPAAIGQQAMDLSYLRGAAAADAARVQLNKELAVKAFILESQVTAVAGATLSLRQQAEDAFPDKNHPAYQAAVMVLDVIVQAMTKAEQDVLANFAAQAQQQQQEASNAPDAGSTGP